MSNVIDLRPTQLEQERYPEFHFEITYVQEPNGETQTDTVTGFLTAMGGIYFIGTGTKDSAELQKRGEVDWLWSAPFEQVRKIKSLAPANIKLDA